MIAVYLASRDEWSKHLKGKGCRFVEDVPGLENPAEAWETSDGRVFLVPYQFLPDVDEDDENERRVAGFILRKIMFAIEGP